MDEPEGERGMSVRPALWVSLAWVVLAGTSIWGSCTDWPPLVDGLLATRLTALGLPVVTLCGFAVAWWLWRRVGTRASITCGAMKIFVALGLFLCSSLLAFLLMQQRERIAIAVGRDPIRPALLVATSDQQLDLRGYLAAGTARRVADMLARHPVHLLHLNSNGGWMDEGERLGRVIRSHGLATDSRTGCHSACVVAYLAGSERRLHPDARLGFHSIAAEGLDPWYIRAGNERFADSLVQMGASMEFRKRVLQTTVADMWFPEPGLLVANHLVHRVTTEGFADSGDPDQ